MSDLTPPSSPPPLKPLPDHLQGWNWGAFWLNWVWGLAHNTWIGLLMFIPGVNLVMMFVLGAKGNVWAWQNNRWRSETHFKSSQKMWARAGWGAALGIPLLIGLMMLGLISLFRSSDAYQMTLDHIKLHPKLEHTLGVPVEPKGWWMTGNIELKNAQGSANFEFDVQGPKAMGTVYSTLSKHNGVWTLDDLEVVTESQQRIELTPGVGNLGDKI